MPAALDRSPIACSVGSPRARVVGLDIDPALLALNRAAHDADPRVTLVEANLSTSAWLQALAGATFDAVLTATALHWLPAERVRRLYAEVSSVLRPEGVLCNADHMPAEPTGPLRKRIGDYVAAREVETFARPGELDWTSSWEALGDDPELAPLVSQRTELFSGDGHPAEETPDARWHLRALRDGGFIDAAVVWRHYDDAVVAGLR